MTEDRPNGVLISDGDDYVRLSFDKLRYDNGLTTATIEVKAGPFQGTVLDDAIIRPEDFCEELSQLHDRLIGEATLMSYYNFRIKVSGNGRGGITVSVELVGRQVPVSKLCFEFEIDQTFLPEIIRRLRDQIPDCPKGSSIRLTPTTSARRRQW